MNARRVLAVVFLALVTSAMLGGIAWVFSPFQPGPAARVALISDSVVSVQESGDWVTFAPAGAPATTGLIFYPGGHVDFRAYAPVAREIASHGYQVTVVRMPASLSIFGLFRADRVMEAYPQVQTWAIGGHSLGGMMAARYAAWRADKVRGVVFWAAFPVADLSRSDLAGALTYGTNDVRIELEAVKATMPFLPPGTDIEPIAGGGHTGFGDYRTYFGGAHADISPELQRAYAADITVRLLEKISGN